MLLFKLFLEVVLSGPIVSLKSTVQRVLRSNKRRSVLEVSDDRQMVAELMSDRRLAS